jgi:peptide subunit release factor 1 (eRF1)
VIEQEGAQPSGRLATAAAGLQQAERFHRLQADPAHRWLRAMVLETCAALRVRP